MLYNVIEGLNGVTVIGRTITGLVRDPLAQALVVGWAFSGLIQGVAGFGLPIAVVAAVHGDDRLPARDGGCDHAGRARMGGDIRVARLVVLLRSSW